MRDGRSIWKLVSLHMAPRATISPQQDRWLTVLVVIQVLKDGADSLASAGASRALLLCYPPSDDSMASDCLQAFR